jgi:hypothetical protein
MFFSAWARKYKLAIIAIMTVLVLGHTRANPFVYFSPIAHASSNAPAHCTQDDNIQN